jgi:hypothetical protein
MGSLGPLVSSKVSFLIQMNMRYLMLCLMLVVAALSTLAEASNDGSCFNDRDCSGDSPFCKFAPGVCGSGAGVCKQKPFVRELPHPLSRLAAAFPRQAMC